MKVVKRHNNNNRVELYDNYLGLEWSQVNCVLARMHSNSQRVKLDEYRSAPSQNLKSLKKQLKEIRGNKILTIEETTTTHWLYVELKEYVDKILICDPYRNSLLSEGAKTDKIDARKLCQLLRSGLVKEVYHSLENDYKIRKLVSTYEDVVKAGVRVLNQRSALYRAVGLQVKKDKLPEDEIYKLVDRSQERSIGLYLEEKKEYEKIFKQLRRSNKTINNLCSISGIAEIGAVKIYSRVIEAGRFPSKYKYWSYCGLVTHEKESGNRSYGKKQGRYSRTLKSVYKTAAWTAVGGKNDIREYYEYLLKEEYLSERKAINQVARYIAKSTLAIIKNTESYKPYSWRKTKSDK
jgi:transposase